MDKTDITSREDIEMLVNRFYDQLMVDDVVGYIFTDVASLDLKEHLPIICNFWETVLLGNITYHGNPMEKHIALNKISHLLPEHFQRWLQLWESTVAELFKGPKADEALQRAKSIAGLMKYKVETS